MDTLAQSVREAAGRLATIIEQICGGCGNACCHQGTMMGSADLRRLYKGMHLDAALRARVTTGLRTRGRELREELAALEQVAEVLQRTVTAEQRPELGVLGERLEEWRDFCDHLDTFDPLDLDSLSYLLRFSAIRSNALRLLRGFPGAVEAVAARTSPAACFRADGRRLSAPRCLFHVADGCLAGVWKPAKCANFFCAGEPNVLAEVAREMPFDDFVQANFVPLSPDQVLRHVELELRLGREFVDPKVIIAPNTALRQALLAALREHFLAVEVKQDAGPFMWSTGEAEIKLGALPPNVAYVIEAESVDGGALYELAVALDRLRVAGTPPAFYLLAKTLSGPTFMPHPMWTDRLMSQPLGFLDLIAVEVAG
ncbi:MAG TPA: hypothetical protein VGM19_02585 [Armatimonadota bacterium]|jgi:hypothetical protein